MKRIILSLLFLVPLPAMAQGQPTQPTTLVLSTALVQEMLYVLNASGAANGTVSRLQEEIHHQPAPSSVPVQAEPQSTHDGKAK